MENLLALEAVHRESGAEFALRMGCRVPEHYGDPAREYEHIRERVGVIDRSYRGQIRVEGREASAFLDRLLSSEVARLRPGEGEPSILLTAKGKIIASFRAFRTGEEAYLLETAEAAREAPLQALAKYAFLSDVQVAEASAERGVLSCEGPRSGEVVKEVFGLASLPPPWKRLEVAWEGASLAVAAGGECPGGGFDLEMPRDLARRTWDALVGAARARGGGPAGLAAAEILRIEAGIPRYGIDYGEANFPGEAGLEGSLTYSKCYVGQEVVARMRTYGHTNRRLQGVRGAGGRMPPSGCRLLCGDEEAGWITSPAASPRCGGIALAMIHRRYWSAGVRLHAAVEGEELMLEVTDLPFLRS